MPKRVGNTATSETLPRGNTRHYRVHDGSPCRCTLSKQRVKLVVLRRDLLAPGDTLEVETYKEVSIVWPVAALGEEKRVELWPRAVYTLMRASQPKPYAR